MNTFVIAKRELTAFFASPLSYIIWAVFLLVTALFFVLTVAINGIATLTQVFQAVSISLLIIAPVLTMRLLAEEVRLGTLELLLTTPVRDWEVVIGKFLAAFVFFITMLAPTLIYLFFLIGYGQPDLPVIISGYIGVIFLGGMLLSVGVLASALSANQVMSAGLGVAVSLTLWLTGGLGHAFQGLPSHFLEYLSIQRHFFDFARGLISSTNLVYFLSLTAASLFGATRILEMKRGR